MLKATCLFATLVCAAAASPAAATIWVFNDPVNGAQETPPNNSLAVATTFGTYDDVTNQLTISILQTIPCQTLVNNAHIHTAPPGVPGGVTIPLPGPFNVSNSYNLPPTNFILTPPQEVDFLAGLMYVNIHTVQIGAGEIRGQLHPVPGPAGLALLGLAGVAVLRRRR